MKKANEMKTKMVRVGGTRRGWDVEAIWCGSYVEEDTKAVIDCWYAPEHYESWWREATEAEEDYLEAVMGDAYWNLEYGQVYEEVRVGTGVEDDEADWDDDDDCDEE